MIVYGIQDCVHCRDALERLNKSGIAHEFRALGDKVEYLKAFLRLRDHLDIFQDVRQAEYIGIPCFVFDDGEVTLDINLVIERYSK